MQMLQMKTSHWDREQSSLKDDYEHSFSLIFHWYYKLHLLLHYIVSSHCHTFYVVYFGVKRDKTMSFLRDYWYHETDSDQLSGPNLGLRYAGNSNVQSVIKITSRLKFHLPSKFFQSYP